MADPQMERPKAKAPEPSTDAWDDAHRLRRVQRTREEMLAQGEALRRSLELEGGKLKAVAEALRGRDIRKIVVLGCGDSWFTAMGIRLAFEQLLRVTTEPAEALDYALYTHHLTGPGSLVIGISSSGKTPPVLAALDKAREQGAYTLGVTNTGGSPIAAHADASLLVRATRAGWPTQATTAAMAVLIGLAIELSQAWQTVPEAFAVQVALGLAGLPGQIEAVIPRHDAALKALAEELVQARLMLFTAAGPHLAAAYGGAGKIKELCPIHAVPFPLEAFHHYRSVKPGDPIFLIAPDAASHVRALDTAEVARYDGGRVMALIPEGEQQIRAVSRQAFEMPPVDPALAPILYSVPLHLFAYHLAMAKFERGLGYPGAFPDDAG